MSNTNGHREARGGDARPHKPIPGQKFLAAGSIFGWPGVSSSAPDALRTQPARLHSRRSTGRDETELSAQLHKPRLHSPASPATRSWHLGGRPLGQLRAIYGGRHLDQWCLFFGGRPNSAGRMTPTMARQEE